MSFFKRLAQSLGGIGQGKHWEETWNARLLVLEELLGEQEPIVYHSRTPFYLGGDADVLLFRRYVDGFAYVTADLTGDTSSWQIPSRIGNYELMICTRQEAEWAPNLISRLARYTLEAPLNPGDTMDFDMFGRSEIQALLFTQPEISRPQFEVRGQECGLLLCIGVTQAEVAASQVLGSVEVIKRLKEAAVFPFTDLERSSLF